MESAGRSTGLALVGAVTTTIANFGLALLVASVSSEFAGVFFTTTAVATIAGNSAALGTMTAQIYFMPRALEKLSVGPRGLVIEALRPVAIAGTTIGIGLAIVAGPLADAISREGANPVGASLRMLAIAIPAWALTASLLGATRGLGSMTPTVVINQVAKPLAQLGGVGVVVLGSETPSTSAVALAWSLPVIAAAMASAIWLWRLGGFKGNGSSALEPGEFWSYARPRALSTGFQIALERIDVVLVSALAGPSAAGVYGAITRFITAGNFLIFSIAQATAPAMRRALSADRRAEAGELLHKATGWMVMLAWPYFLLIAVKAQPVAGLLEPSFDVGASALWVLAVIMLFNAASGPIDLTLLMLGRSGASLAGAAAALSIDVVLAVILVPRYGLVGAALAWGMAVIVQNLTAGILVARTGGIRATGKAAVVAGLGAIVAVVPVGSLTPDTLAGLILTALAAGAIYLLWIVRSARVLGLDQVISKVRLSLRRAGRAADQESGANRAMSSASASADASDES